MHEMIPFWFENMFFFSSIKTHLASIAWRLQALLYIFLHIKFETRPQYCFQAVCSSIILKACLLNSVENTKKNVNVEKETTIYSTTYITAKLLSYIRLYLSFFIFLFFFFYILSTIYICARKNCRQNAHTYVRTYTTVRPERHRPILGDQARTSARTWETYMGMYMEAVNSKPFYVWIYRQNLSPICAQLASPCTCRDTCLVA